MPAPAPSLDVLEAALRATPIDGAPTIERRSSTVVDVVVGTWKLFLVERRDGDTGQENASWLDIIDGRAVAAHAYPVRWEVHEREDPGDIHGNTFAHVFDVLRDVSPAGIAIDASRNVLWGDPPRPRLRRTSTRKPTAGRRPKG